MESDAVTTESEAGEALVLASDLSMTRAEELKQVLLGALENNVSILVDGSAVERVGTSALQLLVGFVREARARAVTVQWKMRSDVLREAASLSGVTTELGWD